MSAELVRRLRLGFFSDVATEIASKAADEIERLTAERETLNRCLFQAQEAAKDLAEQLRAAREQEPVAHIDDLGHIQFTDGGKLKRGDRLYAAPVPPSQEAMDDDDVVERFVEWLKREMPEGTVISDPAWWAPKIMRAIRAIRAELGGQRE